MKRIKNSVKALIIFICIFAVAVAGVVAVIIVNKKGNNDGDNPNKPIYVLTDDQKKLVGEVSSGTKKSVSNSLLDYIKFENSPISAERVSFYDGSVVWSSKTNETNPSLTDYTVFVLDAQGGSMGLVEKMVEQNLIGAGTYSSSRVMYAGKNHFAVNFATSETTRKLFIVSVENHSVVLNKQYDLVIDTVANSVLLDGEELYIDYSENFFVVLLKDERGDFYFNFYEYKNSYDDYEVFKLFYDNSETDTEAYIQNNTFLVNGQVVVRFSQETGFYEPVENDLIASTNLVGGLCLENKTVVNQSVSESELISGVYYKYSYTLRMSGKEDKTIDIDGFTKLSVVYSGEKYFGVFLQKVDSSHNLEAKGQMVYYDYDLNKIAVYSANSSYSTISYSDGSSILTSEGMFSSKNEVSCVKLYDFASNGYTYQRVLSNGNFILEDEYENLFVYNFSLEKVHSVGFESIVNFLDDNNFIYLRNGEYSLYDISKNTAVSIDFVSSLLDNKSSLYITKSGEKYNLCAEKQVLESDLTWDDFSFSDSCLIVNKNGTKKIYYFTERKENVDSVSQILFYGSAIESSNDNDNQGNIELYADGTEDDPFNENNDWYSYDDKISVKNLDTNGKISVKATHCIQNGYYSKSSYFDYFEIAYNNQNSDSVRTYQPFRVYYMVSIENGNPTLSIVSVGHHEIIATSTSAGTVSPFKIEIDGKYYNIGPACHLDANKQYEYVSTALYKSYDYITYRNNVDNGYIQISSPYGSSDIENYAFKGIPVYHYAYTEKAASENNTGFWFHESSLKYDDNEICKAEVYGESIRVSIVFDFTPAKRYDATYNRYITYDLDLENCKFGNEREVIAAYKEKEEKYYENLWYRTVVVGVNNNNRNFNYYSNIIDNINYSLFPLDASEQLKNINVENLYTTEQMTAYGHTNYNMTVSKKMYLSNSFSTVYLGDINFRTKLVGAKFVGITTLNQINFTNLNSSFYSKENRTYIDEAVVYRANPTSGTTTYDKEILPYKGLSNSTGNYYCINVKNDNIIYYEGGLNKFRYVFCIYEPEKFYMKLDYNVSSEVEDDNTTTGNEIDYLKKYAGLNIGVNSRVDYTQVKNTWAYKNVTEAGFGSYNNENHDKYYPNNFLDNSSRIEMADPEMTYEQKVEYVKTHEQSAVIQEFKAENERFFYIVVDGVRYYFQRNHNDNGLPYSNRIGTDREMYLYAIRDKSQFNGGGASCDEDVGDLYDHYGDLFLLADAGEYYSVEDGTYQFYEEGCSEFKIRVFYDSTKRQYVAHYQSKNIHERTSEYIGRYAYDEEGNVVPVGRVDPKFNLNETFSFLYTDDVLFTSLPEHAHYDFVGWKVMLGDYDTKIILSNVGSSGTNIGKLVVTQVYEVINSTFGTLYYLAGSGNKYYNSWLTKDEDGIDEWINNSDNPITLVAQWEPKTCTIDAVLWTHESGSDHLGLKYVGGNKIAAGFTVSKNAIVPAFMMGTRNIDMYKNPVNKANPSGVADGLVDYTPTFKYSLDYTFSDIGVMMSNEGYNSGTLNATGINCQFMNWAFQMSDGTYVSLDKDLEDENTYTKISEYIGDTTTITIYAYYANSRYNFTVNLNPMGGAQNYEADGDKLYYGKNENIFNNSIIPAIYGLEVGEATGAKKKMYTDPSYAGNEGVDRILSIVNETNYSVSFINDFYAGNSIQIKMSVNGEYYFKRIVVRNLTLKNEDNMYEKYTVIFVYEMTEDGLVWKATVKSETRENSTLGVFYKDNVFIFGNNAYNSGNSSAYYNVSLAHNLFSFSQTDNELTINITNLSDPGELDYDTQTLTGTVGFTMECWLSSHSIDTELVTIEHEMKEGEEEDIKYNRAMLISAQTLSDLEGKDVKLNEPCYVWLGTTRYMFSKSWLGQRSTGYYLLYSNGITEAINIGFTYENFIRQVATIDSNMYVFYDDATKMVYYTAQNSYSSSGPGEVSAEVKGDDIKYIMIEGVEYGFSFRAPSNLSAKNYYIVRDFTGNLSSSIGISKTTQEEYENHFYKSGDDQVYVYYDGTYAYYRYEVSKDKSSFKIGYNNTRFLTIEPEQDNVYLSSRPSSMSIYKNRYELKYYISSIVIGNTIFSFDKLTREVVGDSVKKYYSYFTLNNVQHSTGSNISRLDDIIGNTISHFGEEYTINDAFKLSINAIENYVGTTTYYFYVARNEEGYTRYFLIYDESSTNIANSDKNYEIKINFKQYKNQMDILVNEEDLYDINDRSFDVAYISEGGTYFNYTKIYDKLFKDREVSDNNEFYQNGDEIADLSNLSLTKLDWKSSITFYPTETRRLLFKATHGYIIKTIKVYIGRNSYTDGKEEEHDEEFVNIFTFMIDEESSFEGLRYYNVNGNYSYTNSDDGTLRSDIKYKISLDDDTTTAAGYDLIDEPSNKLGVYYSYYKDFAWNYGNSETYNFEQIFLLLSGLYEDVRIEFQTTSYSEFIFENGELGSYNPLLKENIDTVDSEKNYKTLTLSDTYLNIYTRKLDEDGNLIVDDSIETLPYILKYYPETTKSNIMAGTIRLMFYGTGSRIKYGLHILATHEDYSVFFTNGRYYNEPTNNNELNRDAFANLESFSGRTYNDLRIVGSARKTNKLVYLLTGEFWRMDRNEGYFCEDVEEYKNLDESNIKYLVAMTAYINEIDVNTDSYLYNELITRKTNVTEKLNGASFTRDSSDTLISYGFYDDDTKLAIRDSDRRNYIFQLDNKNKTNSWFNDTVLSNIQYNYYDKDTASTISKNWVNRAGDLSEISSQKLKGFKISWDYYEIAGYYLKYILIKIGDFDTYYAISAQEILQEPTLSKTITISDSTYFGYNYTFNVFYEAVNESDQRTGCFRFYPVSFVDDDTSNISKLNTVSLMSNNIKVAFVSESYTYSIGYSKYSMSNVSTADELEIVDSNGISRNYYSSTISTQQIYYDTMVKLNYTLSLPGYTFIGWGSYGYRDSSTFIRYSQGDGMGTPTTWSTASNWLDPTCFFVQEGNSALENARLFSKYFQDTSIPYGAFYVANGYFMTDTGYADESSIYLQNYNFYNDYVSLFSKYIGNINRFNITGGAYNYDIVLYGLFKANTYTIEFDVNNSKGDTYYLDYREDNLVNNGFVSEFTSDKIGFRATVNKKIETFVCYVTFDTNNWFFSRSNGQTLLYSYRDAPYAISSMASSTNESHVIVDMFGYSWLGWYYQRLDDINQGTTLADASLKKLVFKSSYLTKRTTKVDNNLKTFNDEFLQIMRANNSIFDEGIVVKEFTYYGQHKADSAKYDAFKGYVYFYDYSFTQTNGNASNTIEIAGSEVNYNSIQDYLNTFSVDATGNPLYSNNYSSPLVLSFYDTCLSKNSYSVSGSDGVYKLNLDKTAENLRRIKLFAWWSQNKYSTIFDYLDKDTGISVDRLGSSRADISSMDSISGKNYFFNDMQLQFDLNNIAKIYRVGYDFVGWSFNHIIDDGNYAALASTINSASPVIYLCKELLAQYTQLNGAAGTSDKESNVLMINGERLEKYREGDSSWILNQTGTAEGLGDGEDENKRYIYIFPVWKVQTFSINISLNIGYEDLLNLYDKDSSFATMLYESFDIAGSKYTGIASKYFTNSTTTAQYFNDIIANVCFEIDFDSNLSSARLSFNGGNKYYYLKDFFATSAGYYFCGLMYERLANEDNTDNFVVLNTLKSVMDLSGLVYEDNMGEITTSETVFDYDFYELLYNTRFDNKSNSTDSDYNPLNSINTGDVSSNFGFISFRPYIDSVNLVKKSYSASLSENNKQFNIMSEFVNNENYLYIIHNNKKYYVVYYLKNSSSSFSDVITFDKTFLYYNEKDSTGAVMNRYIIRYDSSGNPYYVSNSFGRKVSLKDSLKIALYSSRRNTLYTNTQGGISFVVQYSESNKNGSLIGDSSILGYVNVGLGAGEYILTNNATREFTLYAHWARRENFEAIINNGNNAGSTGDKNNGLAGNYLIEKDDDFYAGDSEKQYTNSRTQNEFESDISLEFGFHSTLDYTFMPYFNGRYMSEMTFEFDTLQETNSGNISTYKMFHNVVVFNFEWSNEKHVITISKITLNGSTVNTDTALSFSQETRYVINYLKGMDIFSILDKSSIGKGESGFRLYKFSQYSSAGGINILGARVDINAITLKLEDVMTSLSISCKFSVQTYEVRVYNVIGSESLGNDEIVKTNFYTKEDMLLSSNEKTYNQPSYGIPYISSIDYANNLMSTISTNCALTPAITYNVPYHYYVNTSKSSTTIRGEISGLNELYGMKYLYGDSSCYYNGTNISTKLQAYHGALTTLSEKINYDFQNWYIFYSESLGYVQLAKYNDQTPIRNNTTIYGYFLNKDAPTKIIFHSWDDNMKQYIKYAGNESEYTSGSANSKLKLVGDKYYISDLPSPAIDKWYGDVTKQFLGYIYITNSELQQIKQKTLDSNYNSFQHKGSNSFKSTTGDVYSALSLNKVISATGSLFGNTAATADKLYDDYVSGLSILDLLKYRMEVYEDNYYTKVASKEVSGQKPTILDSVRVKFGVKINEEVGYIVKDFKMLNIESAFAMGETVYAIPLYEEMKLEIVACNTYENTFKITSNSNMIQSNIFETNSSYTIYYDTKELRFSYNFVNTVTMKRGGGMATAGKEDDIIYQEYNLSTITFTESKEIKFYMYYVKPGNVEFYRTKEITLTYDKDKNKITVTGITNTKAMVDIYYSPLDIALSDENKKIYDNAAEAIDKYGKEVGEKNTVIFDKQLLIYILLQLTQTHCFEYNANVIYPYYGYTSAYTVPANNSGYYNRYSITSVIDIANKYSYGASATKIQTNMQGLYQMAFALVCYQIKEQSYAEGDLEFEKANNSSSAWLSRFRNIFYYASENTLGSDDNPTKYQELNPCDFLLDDRSSEETQIRSILSNEPDIFAYYKKKNTDIGMFLYRETDENDVEYFYVLTSGGAKKVVVTSDDPSKINYSNSFQTNAKYAFVSTKNILFADLNVYNTFTTDTSYDGVCNAVKFTVKTSGGSASHIFYYFGNNYYSAKLYSSSDYKNISKHYPLDYTTIKNRLRSATGCKDSYDSDSHDQTDYYGDADKKALDMVENDEDTKSKIETRAQNAARIDAKKTANAKIAKDAEEQLKNDYMVPNALAEARVLAEKELENDEEYNNLSDAEKAARLDAKAKEIYESRSEELIGNEMTKFNNGLAYQSEYNDCFNNQYDLSYNSYFNEAYNEVIGSKRLSAKAEVKKELRDSYLNKTVTDDVIRAEQERHREKFDEELEKLGYYYKLHYHSLSSVKSDENLLDELTSKLGNTVDDENLRLQSYITLDKYSTTEEDGNITTTVERVDSIPLLYGFTTNINYYTYVKDGDGKLWKVEKSLENNSGYEDANYWIVFPSPYNDTKKAYVYTRYYSFNF